MLITILAIICGLIVIQRVREIIGQYKCPTGLQLKRFYEGKYKKGNIELSDHITAHLGLCEKCQKKLGDLQSGKTDLEDHLIPNKDN